MFVLFRLLVRVNMRLPLNSGGSSIWRYKLICFVLLLTKGYHWSIAKTLAPSIQTNVSNHVFLFVSIFVPFILVGVQLSITLHLSTGFFPRKRSLRPQRDHRFSHCCLFSVVFCFFQMRFRAQCVLMHYIRLFNNRKQLLNMFLFR